MARGEITIKTVSAPKLSVTCLMGADPPKPTGGYGGWEIVPRPRRVALTQWTGREPLQMEVPIVLDGWKQNDSVEYDCTKLERMALPYVKEPPAVKLVGTAVPHNDLDWIIQDIQWGDAMKMTNGDRARQEAVLIVISKIDIDKVRLTAAAKTRAKKGRK